MPETPLWRIDSEQSVVTFSVRALGLFEVEGQIDGIEGRVWRDANSASVQVKAALKRLTMSSERRRRWALSDEFFDAANFPRLVFTASLPNADGSVPQGSLSGQLQLHGVTDAITVQIKSTPCAHDATNCLVQGDAKVSRSHFGMASRRYTLGDQVLLNLDLHLQRVR